MTYHLLVCSHTHNFLLWHTDERLSGHYRYEQSHQSHTSFNYFDLDIWPRNRSLDDSEISWCITVAVQWLHSDFERTTPVPAQVIIIDRMTELAAAARSLGRRRAPHGGMDSCDEEWIYLLSYHHKELPYHCGPSFRRLLHVLEESYIRHLLVGDQEKIKDYLHRALYISHATCEDPGCPWTGHEQCTFGTCSKWSHRDCVHGPCPLLDPETNGRFGLAVVITDEKENIISSVPVLGDNHHRSLPPTSFLPSDPIPRPVHSIPTTKA